jgi:2-polyprenyl-3-methyl-5-hydroxy-6-metoxy-1,4-benzoquinol methylase
VKRLKKYVENTKSILTGNELEIIHCLPDFPIFFGCVDSPIEEDIVADMEWGIDPQCGSIQLTKLVPLEILYREQHVDGTGPTWEKYYDDFADYILKNNPRRVLEIGGGSGKLAHRATKSNPDLEWTIVEPNPHIEQSNQVKVISEFFGPAVIAHDIDTVVFSQVMEHVYNPNEFVSDIGKFLAAGGQVIFAYPQIKLWLDSKFTNALNFEHCVMMDDFVEYIFMKQGFSFADRHIYKNHSIFYKAIKSPTSIPLLSNHYEEYKSIFMNFVSHHERLVIELNSKIRTSNAPVYLFGAHIFATFLFAFGLDRKLNGILDNSKLKQNRRLYGTDFIVSSPHVLKNIGKANVILKAGIYNEEIKKDIIENINPEINFW